MRVFFLTLVVFLCSPAWAGWALVTTTAQGDEFYIDMDTLRIDKNVRRFWTLINLSKRGDRGELSMRVLREIDCKQERDRSLVITGLNGAMGSGDLLGTYKNDNDSWDYIAPQTIMQVYFSKLCPK
jgi:hypothetical protein